MVNIIDGTSGDDPFGTLNGTILDETINGYAGNDVLYGAGGTNILNGGTGNDTFFYQFVGAFGNFFNCIDEIYGGDGFDTIQVLDGVDFRIATVSSIERILFTDTVARGVLNVAFLATQIGTAIASNLNIVGDTDQDVLSFDMGTSSTINLSGFTFTNWVGGASSLDGDLVAIGGTASSETFIGTYVNDYIAGDGGNDLIYSRGGNDYLEGGAGNDSLWGGNGADYHFGGDGIDYARYDDANYGNLTIRLDATYLNTGAAAGDTYLNIEGVVGGLGSGPIKSLADCRLA